MIWQYSESQECRAFADVHATVILYVFAVFIQSGRPYFVAKINEQALAAVSLSFPITTLMNALSIWLGVGVNVRIASYLGQKRQEKADRVGYAGVRHSGYADCEMSKNSLLISLRFHIIIHRL